MHASIYGWCYFYCDTWSSVPLFVSPADSYVLSVNDDTLAGYSSIDVLDRAECCLGAVNGTIGCPSGPAAVRCTERKSMLQISCQSKWWLIKYQTSTNCKPITYIKREASHGFRITHHPQYTILSTPSSVHHASSVHHPQYTILSTPSLVHHPQYTILSTPSLVHHPQYTILSTPSSVHHP